MKTLTVHVGELARKDRGAFKIGPFGSSLKKSELVASGIPVAGIENVLPNEFIKGFRRFVTPRKFNELSDYEIQPGDVLVTTMGTIGRAAVAPRNIGRTIIDSHLFRMRLETSRVSPQFLCYGLNSDFVVSQLKRMARGAIMEGLNTGILKECLIPLPDLPEQKRIAALLEKADRLRRTHRYARQLSDTFLQSVFVEMFGDPLSPLLADSIVRLEDILEVQPQNGLYVPRERYASRDDQNGVEMVHMSDLFNGIVATGRLKRVDIEESEIEKYALCENDLLIARRSINYEGAAKPCRIPILRAQLVFESSMIRIRPDRTKVLALYLYYYLCNEAVRRHRVRRYVTISTISGINQNGLKRIEVVVPPLALQQKFADIVRRFERLRARQDEADRQAEHLFQTLLHSAFSTAA